MIPMEEFTLGGSGHHALLRKDTVSGGQVLQPLHSPSPPSVPRQGSSFMPRNIQNTARTDNWLRKDIDVTGIKEAANLHKRDSYRSYGNKRTTSQKMLHEELGFAEATTEKDNGKGHAEEGTPAQSHLSFSAISEWATEALNGGQALERQHNQDHTDALGGGRRKSILAGGGRRGSLAGGLAKQTNATRRGSVIAVPDIFQHAFGGETQGDQSQGQTRHVDESNGNDGHWRDVSQEVGGLERQPTRMRLGQRMPTFQNVLALARHSSQRHLDQSEVPGFSHNPVMNRGSSSYDLAKDISQASLQDERAELIRNPSITDIFSQSRGFKMDASKRTYDLNDPRKRWIRESDGSWREVKANTTFDFDVYDQPQEKHSGWGVDAGSLFGGEKANTPTSKLNRMKSTRRRLVERQEQEEAEEAFKTMRKLRGMTGDRWRQEADAGEDVSPQYAPISGNVDEDDEDEETSGDRSGKKSMQSSSVTQSDRYAKNLSKSSRTDPNRASSERSPPRQRGANLKGSSFDSLHKSNDVAHKSVQVKASPESTYRVPKYDKEEHGSKRITLMDRYQNMERSLLDKSPKDSLRSWRGPGSTIASLKSPRSPDNSPRRSPRGSAKSPRSKSPKNISAPDEDVRRRSPRGSAKSPRSKSPKNISAPDEDVRPWGSEEDQISFKSPKLKNFNFEGTLKSRDQVSFKPPAMKNYDFDRTFKAGESRWFDEEADYQRSGDPGRVGNSVESGQPGVGHRSAVQTMSRKLQPWMPPWVPPPTSKLVDLSAENVFHGLEPLEACVHRMSRGEQTKVELALYLARSSRCPYCICTANVAKKVIRCLCVVGGKVFVLLQAHVSKIFARPVPNHPSVLCLYVQGAADKGVIVLAQTWKLVVRTMYEWDSVYNAPIAIDALEDDYMKMFSSGTVPIVLEKKASRFYGSHTQSFSHMPGSVNEAPAAAILVSKEGLVDSSANLMGAWSRPSSVLSRRGPTGFEEIMLAATWVSGNTPEQDFDAMILRSPGSKELFFDSHKSPHGSAVEASLALQETKLTMSPLPCGKADTDSRQEGDAAADHTGAADQPMDYVLSEAVEVYVGSDHPEGDDAYGGEEQMFLLSRAEEDEKKEAEEKKDKRYELMLRIAEMEGRIKDLEGKEEEAQEEAHKEAELLLKEIEELVNKIKDLPDGESGGGDKGSGGADEDDVQGSIKHKIQAKSGEDLTVQRENNTPKSSRQSPDQEQGSYGHEHSCDAVGVDAEGIVSQGLDSDTVSAENNLSREGNAKQGWDSGTGSAHVDQDQLPNCDLGDDVDQKNKKAAQGAEKVGDARERPPTSIVEQEDGATVEHIEVVLERADQHEDVPSPSLAQMADQEGSSFTYDQHGNDAGDCGTECGVHQGAKAHEHHVVDQDQGITSAAVDTLCTGMKSPAAALSTSSISGGNSSPTEVGSDAERRSSRAVSDSGDIRRSGSVSPRDSLAQAANQNIDATNYLIDNSNLEENLSPTRAAASHTDAEHDTISHTPSAAASDMATDPGSNAAQVSAVAVDHQSSAPMIHVGLVEFLKNDPDTNFMEGVKSPRDSTGRPGTTFVCEYEDGDSVQHVVFVPDSPDPDADEAGSHDSPKGARVLPPDVELISASGDEDAGHKPPATAAPHWYSSLKVDFFWPAMEMSGPLFCDGSADDYVQLGALEGLSDLMADADVEFPQCIAGHKILSELCYEAFLSDHALDTIRRTAFEVLSRSGGLGLGMGSRAGKHYERPQDAWFAHVNRDRGKTTTEVTPKVDRRALGTPLTSKHIIIVRRAQTSSESANEHQCGLSSLKMSTEFKDAAKLTPPPAKRFPVQPLSRGDKATITTALAQGRSILSPRRLFAQPSAPHPPSVPLIPNDPSPRTLAHTTALFHYGTGMLPGAPAARSSYPSGMVAMLSQVSEYGKLKGRLARPAEMRERAPAHGVAKLEELALERGVGGGGRAGKAPGKVASGSWGDMVAIQAKIASQMQQLSQVHTEANKKASQPVAPAVSQTDPPSPRGAWASRLLTQQATHTGNNGKGQSTLPRSTHRIQPHGKEAAGGPKTHRGAKQGQLLPADDGRAGVPADRKSMVILPPMVLL